MPASKHRVRRNVRGGVAAGAVLVAVSLTAGAVYTGTAGADPAPSCADAITAYQHAVAAEQTTNAAQATAVRNDQLARGTHDAAVSNAQQAYTTWLAANPNATDAQKAAQLAARDKAIKAADDAYKAGGTQAALEQASSNEKTASSAMNNAKAAADTACTGLAGPVGAQGPAGVAGKDGIDAKIILAPTVCARAVVTTNPAKLVRIVALIPCPPAVPPAPPAPPVAGQPVQEISTPAPTPQTVPGNLPVTH